MIARKIDQFPTQAFDDLYKFLFLRTMILTGGSKPFCIEKKLTGMIRAEEICRFCIHIFLVNNDIE